MLKRKYKRLKGRPSTWATIKQLREYKSQLEIENEKITQGIIDNSHHIHDLESTLSSHLKNTDHHLPDEVNQLLLQYASIIPDHKPKLKEAFRPKDDR